MALTLPLWGVLGFVVALISTFVPLIQEKYKAEPLPLVIWLKLVVVIMTVPFLFLHGLPDTPLFYISTFFSACLWAVSDMYYFNAVRKVGSGVVTRVIPSAVIITFLVWTMIDAPFRAQYFSNPTQAIAIALTILMSVFFAFRLSKCPVSWNGIRLLWFVLFAVAIGPILDKLSIGTSNTKSAPYAFTFVQAAFTVILYSLFNLKTRALSWAEFIKPETIKAGVGVGFFVGAATILRSIAYSLVDNPAYLTVILFTDALWVLLIYKLIGRKEDSDIWAGVGIVFCAMALVLIKSM